MKRLTNEEIVAYYTNHMEEVNEIWEEDEEFTMRDAVEEHIRRTTSA